MIDIVDFNSSGMQVYDTQTQQAANILSVQLGALEYAQDLGIDLRYFLDERIQFQDESFKGYLIQALAQRGINVASLTDLQQDLLEQYNINLSPQENSTGMVVR